MITIKKINSSIIDDVKFFLSNVPSIDKIDEEILKNACIAYDEDKIVGCISFEKFSLKGLIRYFVFKKALTLPDLEELLNVLEINAKALGINMLVCIAECNQIEELFKSLSFNEIERKYIFLNEESILKTNFKSSSFLYKLV